MTETPTPADLSYLKRIAHAGRGRPAPFLPVMAVFGAGYGLCFLLIYASIVIDGADDPGGLFYPWVHYIPPVAHLAFIVMAVWTAWRTFVSRGRGLSRAATAAWSAAFAAFVTVIVAYLYAAAQPTGDVAQTAFMLPMTVLALWGAAWWATALMTDRRWLLIVAVASFAATLAAAVVGNTVELVLLVGLSLLGLACFPAILLMRERAG
ncbi:hypothetical protein HZ989_07530 [Brevundimonas sp. AJA228-03]|uniref:hypothetical protein n=1 Tax=Brevundimonas sp. AJA228-03 TaxID=2752515 RepID=UPI001ADFE30C|nr:hypothetical protein [Brevundimonas sp. AJA228-03]QTN20885.1 hypothetical protein HZ989_07530 [Brevundimonas sp. AJA228-03]